MFSLQTDADLSRANTLGLAARAGLLCVLHDPARLPELLAHPQLAGLPRRVLGGGSNLVMGRELPGVTIKLENRGRRLLDEQDDAVLLAVAGGENWHELVLWTLAQGWPGLENLALIPGSVGAAPIQNIGAYGLELKDRFHHLIARSLDDGSQRRFDLAQCRFGYRDSVFKHEEAGRWLIEEVVLQLPKRWQPKLDYGDLRARLGTAEPTAQAVAEAVMAVRRSKLPDPAVLGNAGSFFHNPVVSAEEHARLHVLFPDLIAYPLPDGRFKLAAGWLIERAGWKGRRLGPVGMYSEQALVLVNHGGADANDVARLAEAVTADVLARFGVRLTPEPVWW
ncbi:UDP-N-acetylmuramate dehydrogenase [Chitinimonas lacunae]|uniref:UDP-N-acetylenolpyruvoylglucosamine reductase n=1 Tax=Chitinimonas lacunae TaxID=1963018 RepID=A0ABV8MTB4_9NEIS